jgi:hypothetical protein
MPNHAAAEVLSALAATEFIAKADIAPGRAGTGIHARSLFFATFQKIS